MRPTAVLLFAAAMFAAQPVTVQAETPRGCLRIVNDMERLSKDLLRFSRTLNRMKPARICREIDAYNLRLDRSRTLVLNNQAACGFPPDVRESLSVAKGYLNQVIAYCR